MWGYLRRRNVIRQFDRAEKVEKIEASIALLDTIATAE
jgi:hypothetical protein